MTTRIVALIAISGIVLFAFTRSGKTLASPADGKRVPVIVELFTSEGCSSCPPADALLRELEAKQPVPNAEVIVFGEHVDYWNYIGWTDRFSSKGFSERQQQYGNTFNLDSIYTPQMVVDGRAELNGADESRARKEIAGAANQPRVSVELTPGAVTGDSLPLKVVIGASPSAKEADLIIAVTESNLETQVKKGENDGRTLLHTGVVRILKKVGDVKSAGFSGELQLRLDSSWKRADLRLVVFVQEKGSRHIVGAAATKLPS